MQKYEVVVIGAGPAGLKCAEILAKNNKKVLVLEKNKILGKKVCAGGLTIKDFDLGIPSKLIQRKFKKLILHTPLQTTSIKLEKDFVLTIKREDLGKWMFEKAIKAGAEIRKNATVNGIHEDFIVVNGKEKIGYSYLIGADGSNSILRKYLNINNDKFGQAFQYITSKKFKDIQLFLDPERFGHYVWIFPHKNFTSIGTGGDFIRGRDKLGLGFTMSELRKNFDRWCEGKFNIKKAKFQAATINYDYKGHEFGNKYLIGDAGGFASGLSGEGIYYAIKSGEDVANKIVDKTYTCPNIAHILRIKSFEEKILRSFESGRKIAEVEFEALNFLAKLKLVDRELIKF
jgi:geranylgeranyl reductase